MNVEKILTEVYWDLSPLSDDQIKYPDYDTLRKRLKKYLNSRYGTIIAKEVNNEESKKHTFVFSEPVYVKEGEVIKGVNMAGFLNAQVQEWYEKNKDLLSVIDKLTKRCEKLEEENTHLKDEVKAAVSREEVTKKNLEWRTHEVTDLNNCLAKKNAEIKNLKCKVTELNSCNAINANKIFNNCIAEKNARIKELEQKYDDLVDKYEELQASYDNCVNECSDHVIEIDSLLQNLEVATVEQGIEKIKVLKAGCLITFDFSAEADLRVENEKLKMKIEDLRKDVQFEFDHRMAVLAASVDQDAKIAELKDKLEKTEELLKEEAEAHTKTLSERNDLQDNVNNLMESKERLAGLWKREYREHSKHVEELASCKAENEKLKSFIKDRTKEIHEMSEEIEKRLAKYREKYGEEKNNE